MVTEGGRFLSGSHRTNDADALWGTRFDNCVEGNRRFHYVLARDAAEAKVIVLAEIGEPCPMEEV